MTYRTQWPILHIAHLFIVRIQALRIVRLFGKAQGYSAASPLGVGLASLAVDLGVGPMSALLVANNTRRKPHKHRVKRQAQRNQNQYAALPHRPFTPR